MPIRRVSQASQELIIKSKNKTAKAKSRKSHFKIFPQIKLKIKTKGRRMAIKIAKALGAPMVLKETDLAKAKGRKNWPKN